MRNCHLLRIGDLPSLVEMMCLQRAAAVFGATISCLIADEPAREFLWAGPKVDVSIFTTDLGMLDSEREEYATNLATAASNYLAVAKASPASLVVGRKIIALALQLSPRNKRAVVVNFQLTRGILPEIVESNYSPPVLARLILTRGQILTNQGGAENLRLARYFIHLAAELDPKNEDAVYASEVQRLDQGTVDWSWLTEVKAAK